MMPKWLVLSVMCLINHVLARFIALEWLRCGQFLRVPRVRVSSGFPPRNCLWESQQETPLVFKTRGSGRFSYQLTQWFLISNHFCQLCCQNSCQSSRKVDTLLRCLQCLMYRQCIHLRRFKVGRLWGFSPDGNARTYRFCYQKNVVSHKGLISLHSK